MQSDQMPSAPRGSSSGLAVEYAEDFAAWESQLKRRLPQRLMRALRLSTYRAFIAYGAMWVPECLAYSHPSDSSAGAGLAQPAQSAAIDRLPGRDA